MSEKITDAESDAPNRVTAEKAIIECSHRGIINSTSVDRLKLYFVDCMPNIHHPSNLGILVPGIRTIDDFRVGSPVVVYDPRLHENFIHTQVVNVPDEYNQDHLIWMQDQMQETITICPPNYFGLWPASDFEILHQLHGEPNPRQRTPVFLLSVIQQHLVPDTSPELIRKICRKFNVIWQR